MKPVIFLAFANDRVDYTRYLRNLSKEYETIEDVLRTADKQGFCELVPLYNANLQRIADKFQDERYRDRIAVFHFGGHGDKDILQLETSEGGRSFVNSDEFSKFLLSQKNLKMVFLNACNTQNFAKTLVENGISAIGTTQKVEDDELLLDLIYRFYFGIAEKMNLERAFLEAQSLIKSLQYNSKNSPDFWQAFFTDKGKNWKFEKQNLPSSIIMTEKPINSASPSTEKNNFDNMDKGTLIKLLMKAFNDEGLDVFCMSYFDEVFNNFADGLSKTKKIMALISYCEQRLQIPKLEELIKQERTEMYEYFHIEYDKSISRNVQESNKTHSELYDYCLNFSGHLDGLATTIITDGRDKRKNDFVFLVHGVSRYITSTKGDELEAYEFFTKHLFKKALQIEIDSQPPILIKDINSKWSGDIVHELLNKLEVSLLSSKRHDKSYLYDSLFEGICNKIQNNNLIIPFRLLDDGKEPKDGFTKLMTFIDKYWIPIVEKIKKERKPAYSIVLLVLMEEIKNDVLVSKRKIDFEYEKMYEFFPYLINELEYEIVNSWIQRGTGFFTRHKKQDVKDECSCKKDDFLPECKSMEGLFEKIFPMIDENLNVVQFFKKFETH